MQRQPGSAVRNGDALAREVCDHPRSVPPQDLRHHAVIVPDSCGTDARPVCLSGAGLAELLKDVEEKLEKVGSGWLYVFSDGERMVLSKPVPVFRLRGPQGQILEMGGGEVGWSEDGRFDFSDWPDAGRRFLDN